MNTEETCDVLPTGFIGGTMTAADTYTHIRSGAIPRHYVSDRIRERLTVMGWVFVVVALATFMVVH